jgi:hypothetical protein
MFTEFDKVLNGINPSTGSFTSVQSFVNLLANFFVVVGAGLSIVAIGLGLVQLVTSTGDAKNFEKAQRTIMWGIFGFIISVAAYTLKNVLIHSIGAQGIQ